MQQTLKLGSHKILLAMNPCQNLFSNRILIEIGFNVSYLLDVLNNIEAEEVCFVLSDANSSALIEPKDDDSCCYVVMPMRL